MAEVRIRSVSSSVKLDVGVEEEQGRHHDARPADDVMDAVRTVKKSHDGDAGHHDRRKGRRYDFGAIERICALSMPANTFDTGREVAEN